MNAQNRIREASEKLEQAVIQLSSQLHNPVPSILVIRQVTDKVRIAQAIVNDIEQEMLGAKPKVGV